MTADKKPWYKKIWIWAIVAAVLILGGIGQALTSNDEPVDVPTMPPTETPENTSAAEPAGPSDTERTQTLEAAIKTALGVDGEFSDLYAQDPTLWGGHITDITVDGSNAHVTLQVAPDADNRDDLGERAAQALSTLLTGDAIDGIDWFIVEDATGTVIAQEQPA